MIRVKKTRNHYWAWVSRRCSTTQATVQFYINRGFYVQTWDSKNRKWRNH